MVVLDERAALQQAVAELAPEIRARAGEIERARQVPGDLMDRIKAAGLCRLALPASLGGLEIDLMSVVELIEDLSAADGSTGWTTLIGNATAFTAWLDPDVAASFLGEHANVSSTSMFGPLGRGIEEGGSIVVNGRWPFNSGIPTAELVQVGIFVMDGDAPRQRPDGLPDWRFVYLRRDDVEIIDTWDAAGLRGTGSHDIAVTDLRVPVEHTAMPIFDAARHDGPMWRLPFFTVARAIIAGSPLGIARRALDEIAELARTKRRGMSPTTVAEDRVAQVELARSEGGLQAARAFLFDALDEAWSIAVAGDRPGRAQELRVQLAVQQTMRAALDAVDVAFRLGGGAIAYDSHPIQRCFRDAHVASQHIVFSDETWAEYGRYRLGIG